MKHTIQMLKDYETNLLKAKELIENPQIGTQIT